MTHYDKVIEFHKKYDVHIGKIGHRLSDDRALLRIRLIAEEFAEAVEAIQKRDYASIAKELADVLYVVHGAAVEWGIPINEVFDAVHESNMTKDPAKDSGSKVLKGPNYEPPQIIAVLNKALRESNKKHND